MMNATRPPRILEHTEPPVILEGLWGYSGSMLLSDHTLRLRTSLYWLLPFLQPIPGGPLAQLVRADAWDRR